MTDNHAYNTPADGTTNWDEPLNENFQLMETDVEVRDVEANRSNYTPHDGAKYVATDTGDVYLGDGSSWNQLGTIGTIEGNVYVQSSEPANPSPNDIWIDTSNL